MAQRRPGSSSRRASTVLLGRPDWESMVREAVGKIRASPFEFEVAQMAPDESSRIQRMAVAGKGVLTLRSVWFSRIQMPWP